MREKESGKTQHIMMIVKGLVIGGTMMVPGVSGGSMAMILGIYDKFVTAVSSFRKHKMESLRFLLMTVAGGAIGMFLFSKPLLHLIEIYPFPTLYFFIGAVIGGIPLIFRKTQLSRFSIRGVCYVMAGIAVVLAISLIPLQAEVSASTGLSGAAFLSIAGFIAAVALVLPGISVSYLLLMLGLYDETMKAISDVYLPYLIPLTVGLLMGIVLMTKILERCMIFYPQPTYLMILGFVLGSLHEVFPGIPQGAEILLCIITFSAGFAAILFLSKKGGASSSPDLSIYDTNGDD